MLIQIQIQNPTFSNCSGSGAEISPEASFASKASMSRSFFLNNGKDYLNFYNEASNVIKIL